MMATKHTELIVVTDPGKDLDDENTLVLLKALSDQGLVRLRAVLAVLAPSYKRAMLAKGTLNQLGLHVPVGIGSGLSDKVADGSYEFSNACYMAELSEVMDGNDLLLETLCRAEDNSITWLIIAGMTDVSRLLKTHEDLFFRKTKSVVIMGGVEHVNGVVAKEGGFMVPDTAANNMFDEASAQFLYRRLQEIGVPMTIVTREAAYACQVPRSHYENLAETGHQIGLRLKATQQAFIEALWRCACAKPDSPERKGLPNRCTKEWFIEVFCHGKGHDRTSQDEIWDLVAGFNLYDPLACLASVPSLKEQLFEPNEVIINGCKHEVIGLTKANHGIKDTNQVIDDLQNYILKGLEA